MLKPGCCCCCSLRALAQYREECAKPSGSTAKPSASPNSHPCTARAGWTRLTGSAGANESRLSVLSLGRSTSQGGNSPSALQAELGAAAAPVAQGHQEGAASQGAPWPLQCLLALGAPRVLTEPQQTGLFPGTACSEQELAQVSLLRHRGRDTVTGLGGQTATCTFCNW